MAIMKAAGIGGSILALIALLIVLVKSLIALVGFVTGAIKILIILAFVALILGVGFLILKGFADRKRKKD
jgi:hypothetical protein